MTARTKEEILISIAKSLNMGLALVPDDAIGHGGVDRLRWRARELAVLVGAMDEVNEAMEGFGPKPWKPLEPKHAYEGWT
jgi:hypothetical protein